MLLPERLPPPIGGYFGLELPTAKPDAYDHLAAFQSGRAAFRALLAAGKPDRVWMPRYICDAMFEPLAATGIAYRYYDLTPNLEVDYDTVDLAAGDWLLYVNYFGVCGSAVARVMERIPRRQLVLDYCQAYFAPPPSVLATIYSPRKFFGLPDGGLLASGLELPVPQAIDGGSVARCSHLLRRLDAGAEAGYGEFRVAERSLEDGAPEMMSALTRRLLASVDREAVAERRRENFQFLHRRLAQRNGLSMDVDAVAVPLCYPFLASDAGVRERLLARRIFVPTYWPDALARVGGRWEETMVARCLPLPIDQRYDTSDMKRIVATVVADAGAIDG